jgi:hypothetical protein
MSEQKTYKVYTLLDLLLPLAAKEQQAGYSVDVRIYARRKPNGDLWGEVAFLDQDGHIVKITSTSKDSLPLGNPDDVKEFLSAIADEMFEAVKTRTFQDEA